MENGNEKSNKLRANFGKLSITLCSTYLLQKQISFHPVNSVSLGRMHYN